MSNAEALMVRSSAGLATLIGDAIYRSPSEPLHRIAALVAIERGESDVASEHLAHCDAPDLEYSLSLLEGRTEETDLSKSGAKLILSEAARRMDDRLPGQNPDPEILDLLDLIDFSDIDDDMKKVILVAMAHIRHAWYISNSKWSAATKIREGLESISHADDPQLHALNIRAEIAQTPPNSPNFERLIGLVFSKSGLRSTMLQVTLVQSCEGDRAKNLLNRIEMPSADAQNNLSSARRIAAQIWFLRATHKTHNQFSAMAESVALWQRALCPTAAKEAADMMHKLL